MDIAAALLLLTLGSFFLAVAMPKHFRQYFTRSELTKSRQRILKVCGWLLLFLGQAVLILFNDTALAIVTFLGTITVSIFSVALVSTFFDRNKNRQQ